MSKENLIELTSWQNNNLKVIKGIGLIWAIVCGIICYFFIDYQVLFLVGYIFFLTNAIYFPKYLVKIKVIQLSFWLKKLFLKLNNIIIAFILFSGIIGVVAIFFKILLKKSNKLAYQSQVLRKTKIIGQKNKSFFKEEDQFADLISKYC
ncbi:hypothetical protein LBMAG18_09430 [Alphaproteobacteria bacterium]|nr:hypothetical protein LBMAG18_09430 [Alphaproteobacteria bacterium]